MFLVRTLLVAIMTVLNYHKLMKKTPNQIHMQLSSFEPKMCQIQRFGIYVTEFMIILHNSQILWCHFINIHIGNDETVPRTNSDPLANEATKMLHI